VLLILSCLATPSLLHCWLYCSTFSPIQYCGSYSFSAMFSLLHCWLFTARHSVLYNIVGPIVFPPSFLSILSSILFLSHIGFKLFIYLHFGSSGFTSPSIFSPFCMIDPRDMNCDSCLIVRSGIFNSYLEVVWFMLILHPTHSCSNAIGSAKV